LLEDELTLEGYNIRQNSTLELGLQFQNSVRARGRSLVAKLSRDRTLSQVPEVHRYVHQDPQACKLYETLTRAWRHFRQEQVEMHSKGVLLVQRNLVEPVS
jgi:hypothetical protein